MKKLLFLLAILIPFSGYSQKLTSDDVLDNLKTMIGQNVVKIDDNVMKVFNQYNFLRIREMRKLPTKDATTYNQIEPMSIKRFCFTCKCPHCGAMGNMGNGDCSNYPMGCGLCYTGDGYQMEGYVQACEGSTCGNIIGAL
jgi:hypothetical protein